MAAQPNPSSKDEKATPDRGPSPSPTLSPSDHVQMLVELLRPAGAELGRRWLACLMLAPEHERQAIVDSVEHRMSELYLKPGEARRVNIAHPPEQRDGFIEQKFTTYQAREPDDSVG